MEADPFRDLRPRLFGIAYRMLGVRADAEDVLQDAWLRWREADPAQLRSPEAWLVTVVTRLAIDRLRALRAEREAYAGDWLPEPIVALDERTPEAVAELASDLSVAFLHLLERLGPEERAAFLLRQVFEYGMTRSRRCWTSASRPCGRSLNAVVSDGERIVAIHAVRKPDKLANVLHQLSRTATPGRLHTGDPMTARLDYHALAPKSVRALSQLSFASAASTDA